MLTGLEEKILQCITRYITQNGRSPTLDEIGQLLEIRSKGTIHRYVKSLIDKGHLQRSGRNWRGLRLAGEQNRRLTILPLAGRIAAGKPIEAISEQYEINFSDVSLIPLQLNNPGEISLISLNERYQKRLSSIDYRHLIQRTGRTYLLASSSDEIFSAAAKSMEHNYDKEYINGNEWLNDIVLGENIQYGEKT